MNLHFCVACLSLLLLACACARGSDTRAVCLEEENHDKMQELLRMYRRGPISLDPAFITLRSKIGSGFFGDVFLATIPLRHSLGTTAARQQHPSSSLSPAAREATGNPKANNNITNYIQVAVKVLKDSSLFNSRVSLRLSFLSPIFFSLF